MASQATNPKPDHIVFDELFCAARRDRRSGELLVSAHEAMVRFAKERGWDWARDLEEAIFLGCQDKHADALAALDRCKSQVPAEYVGYAHLLRARVLVEKGDYHGASDTCRELLAQPGHVNLGRVWTTLSVCLRKTGDLDGAIEAARKALAQPEYDQPGHAWNNLGSALAMKGDLDGAIEAFRTALARPEYDMPDYAWGNIGNTLFLKGDLEGAIDAYRKSLAEPKYDSAVRAWTGLGWTYAERGHLAEAREAYRTALASPDRRGKLHAMAREGLAGLPPGPTAGSSPS